MLRAGLKVMAVADPGLESGAVSPSKELLALVRDQDHFTCDDPDELVLGAMPVALARPGPRRQRQQVDSEVAQLGRISERLAHTFPARQIEWSGVAAAFAARQRILVDFIHG